MVDKKTYGIAEFAALLGLSRSLGYAEAAKGELAGIPVIRVGKRMVVSRVAADRVLAGVRAGDVEHDV
jgi:hypothetical protein